MSLPRSAALRPAGSLGCMMQNASWFLQLLSLVYLGELDAPEYTWET